MSRRIPSVPNSKAHASLTEVEKAQVIASYLVGKSGKEIANGLKGSTTLVYPVLKKAGVTRSISEVTRKYTLWEEAFDDAQHNPEAAYWCGLLMTDGNIFYPKRWGSPGITIGLTIKDSKHLEKLKRFLRTNKPLYKRRNDRGYGGGKPIVILQITSAKLVTALANYGIVPNKSKIAEVKILENNPHFWRGCIDGDGSVSFTGDGYPFIRLCGSRRLIEQFALFIKNNLRCSIPTIHPDHTIWSVQRKGSPAVQLIKMLYRNDGPSLDRKQDTANKIMNWKGRDYKDRSDWTLERLTRLKSWNKTWVRVARVLGDTYTNVYNRWRWLNKQMTSV